MVGMNSNPAPSVGGVQPCMIMPLGTYITPKRLTGFAALLPTAVNAGTMPSSNGSASVAPIPRSILRRDNAFLVIIIRLAPTLSLSRNDAHRERLASHDLRNERRPTVLVGSGRLDDC